MAPGRKPLPPGTESVTFNVQPNVYRYLQRLIRRSGIGGTPDEVAKHLFTVELLRAMRTRKYEIDDPENADKVSSAASEDDSR